jgi:hypothetical protein
MMGDLMGSEQPKAIDLALDQALDAACTHLREQWRTLVEAVTVTGGSEPVRLAITVRYKPGSETRMPEVVVGSRASVPTLPSVFRARIEGSQLVLSLGVPE